VYLRRCQMSVPVLLNVCNESCSNKIGLPTTLYEHVNGFQRAGEIYRLLSLYHHGFVSLNMEMLSRFRRFFIHSNGTTGIAHCHLNWGENLWNCNGRFHAERNQMMHLTNWSRQAGIPWSGRWWDSGRRRAASWRLAANLSQTLATRVPDLRQPADLPAAGSEGGGSWWLAGTHSLSAGQIDPT